MPLWDKFKRRDPTPQEQANWEALADAERTRRREQRKKELQGRSDSKNRMLDQMRKF